MSSVTKSVPNMANSADPDETPQFLWCLIWVYAIWKCSLFGIVCINASATFPQLRTLNIRQATPLCRIQSKPSWKSLWPSLDQKRLLGERKSTRGPKPQKTKVKKAEACNYMHTCIIALKASGRDCTNNNRLLHKIGVLQSYAMQLFVFTSENLQVIR